MKHIHSAILLIIASLLLLTQTVWAQTRQLSGLITDAANKPLAGAHIVLKGQLSGAVSNAKGAFTITTNRPGPYGLQISMLGFESQSITLSDLGQPVRVSLTEAINQLQDVVVAASRVEETILKAPVSIEKMDIRGIRETPSPSFYDGLNSLKGVDMVTSGLTYKQINTRGFASTGNSRFLQLIDGIDNQPPGFGFSMGNLFGLSDLDAESADLFPVQLRPCTAQPRLMAFY